MKLPIPVRRAFYRAAYWGLRFYWLLFRPEIQGVKCAVRDGRRVLLVRHTYGSRKWDLPGGTMKRGEEPVVTARREMAEELGIDFEEWRLMGEMRGTKQGRRDRLHCFETELCGRSVVIDRGELDVADWFDPDGLPDDVAKWVAVILSRAS